MSKSSEARFALFVLLTFALLSNSHALLPFQPSAEELRALPGFCRGHKPPIKMYYSSHYCNGLKSLNRAYRPSISVKDRNYYLSDAAQKFKEVIEHTEDLNEYGHYDTYLGLVYRYQADVYRRMGEYGKTIKGYLTAIHYNPKGIRAYLELSNLYKRRGLKKDAKEVLEQGLEAVPDSKVLKHLLEKL